MQSSDPPYHIFDSTIAWQRNMLHVFVFRLQQGPTIPHEHVFHEIVFVEEGTIDHVTVAGTQKLHPGDVVILKPRVWHQYQNPQNLKLINCLFDNKLLRDYGVFFGLTSNGFDLFRRPVRDSRNTPPTVLHARPAKRVRLLNFLETIIAEDAEKSEGWQAAVIAQLLGFLVEIGRLEHATLPKPKSRQGSHAENAVIEAVEYLEAHFRETISLSDLAKQLHLSPSYLSRSFSHRMGMGLIEFQHHLRIEEACRMLRFTTDPISLIAGAVGYDEIAYFSRCFRRELGSSPRQYRAIYNPHFAINKPTNIRERAL